ncbi:MAG: MFS transporter [Gammaproteobacteria bacterium]|nr:MFS transporter [Gammaproteobacteria bacterium]
MNSIERRAAISLALIYATRMLGLFMILPVFAIYAEQLTDVTPLLVGLAIGIYGLTQAAFQIPFGTWSDKIGRKPVIITGLAIFMLGSVIAAQADSIYWVIVGRAMQGMGAIASAIMALASDLTREEQRTKVMAIIGASIGASFMLALVLGPVLQAWVGVPGIFWITAILAVMGIIIVAALIPTPVQAGQKTAVVNRATLGSVLSDSQLLRLDAGVFLLHMALTAIFVVVPLILRDQYQIIPAQHWKVYLTVMIVSLILLVPTIIVSEKYKKIKIAFSFAIFICAIGLLVMAWSSQSFKVFFISMVMFFWGFNFLEASMPSLVSKLSNPLNKGMSMGVFSSSQFLGAFAGGVMAGLLLQNFDQNAVFLFAFVMFLIWFLVAFSMQTPVDFMSYTAHLGKIKSSQIEQVAVSLQALPGVAEATVIPEEGIAYLRVNRDTFEEDKVKQFCTQLN